MVCMADSFMYNGLSRLLTLLLCTQAEVLVAVDVVHPLAIISRFQFRALLRCLPPGPEALRPTEQVQVVEVLVNELGRLHLSIALRDCGESGREAARGVQVSRLFYNATTGRQRRTKVEADVHHGRGRKPCDVST